MCLETFTNLVNNYVSNHEDPVKVPEVIITLSSGNVPLKVKWGKVLSEYLDGSSTFHCFLFLFRHLNINRLDLNLYTVSKNTNT